MSFQSLREYKPIGSFFLIGWIYCESSFEFLFFYWLMNMLAFSCNFFKVLAFEKWDALSNVFWKLKWNSKARGIPCIRIEISKRILKGQLKWLIQAYLSIPHSGILISCLCPFKARGENPFIHITYLNLTINIIRYVYSLLSFGKNTENTVVNPFPHGGIFLPTPLHKATIDRAKRLL